VGGDAVVTSIDDYYVAEPGESVDAVGDEEVDEGGDARLRNEANQRTDSEFRETTEEPTGLYDVVTGDESVADIDYVRAALNEEGPGTPGPGNESGYTARDTQSTGETGPQNTGNDLIPDGPASSWGPWWLTYIPILILGLVSLYLLQPILGIMEALVAD
jgi:hypothetical protein